VPEEVSAMLDTIMLGLACMSAPLFAKYAGHEIKRKPYDLVGTAGLFFILAASFTVGPSKIEAFHELSDVGMLSSYLLGWILLVIGALRGMMDVLLEHNHRVMLKAH
jgi:hypothetical protein